MHAHLNTDKLTYDRHLQIPSLFWCQLITELGTRPCDMPPTNTSITRSGNTIILNTYDRLQLYSTF